MLLQRQSLAIRPLTTAHLAQTMTLLGLSVTELRQKIEAELASNPALELVEERRCPVCHRPLMGCEPCPICSRPEGASVEQPIVYLSPREDFFSYTGAQDDTRPEDNLAPEVETLSAFVLRQIAADLAPEDRRLAAHLLTSLDEDGLLSVSLAEIARYHHVAVTRVEDVLHMIQRAEPVGVGSPTPQQALLVQLEVLSERRPIPATAAKAIREGLPLLSRHHYPELSVLLGVSPAEAKEVSEFISDNLNPFPARAHWGENHPSQTNAPAAYRAPDAIITQLRPDDQAPLVVEVITPFSGTLQLNPLFREALRQAPTEKTDQWRDQIEQASLLVKCLQQRNQAVVRLMQRLAVLQRDFILFGEAYHRSITRASLAKELDVHESTISRAVSEKAVQLPNGRIIPMAKFFDRSLQVRTAIKKIIDQEAKALSDVEIADLLQPMGFPVARRTVAKYRAMEGILPSHLRKPI